LLAVDQALFPSKKSMSCIGFIVVCIGSILWSRASTLRTTVDRLCLSVLFAFSATLVVVSSIPGFER